MKKILFAIGGFLVLLIVVFAFRGSASGGVLNGDDFISKYKSTPDSVLLDVRTPGEYNSGYIDGAVNLDYENSNFIDEVKKLDPTKTYFVYCRSGNRSGKAITLMNNLGFKNTYDLQGGITRYSELLNK
jgi:rhodanese-related sulfurtransferase